VQVHFRDAGHILGSAIVVIDVDEKRGQARLVFSGDIGRNGLPILGDPQVAEHVDYVIMESTYGNRSHESTGEAKETLRQAAQEVYDRRGKLIIPAFAVGRTQELVYGLNRLWEEGKLPPIQAFVDSPLAVNVTEVFRLHPECYDEEAREALSAEDDRNPLSYQHLRYIRDVEDSMRLNDMQEPAIIISASGMAEAGRILHHLKHHVGEPNSMVMFVGYQAENTLGRKLLDGQNPVPILGEDYPVRARVRKAEGYSAHADRTELLSWVGRIQSQGELKRVFLVHGEEEGLTALAGGLREQAVPQVDIPDRGQVFEL
jgi:metallo-beta-lactamase family protein